LFKKHILFFKAPRKSFRCLSRSLENYSENEKKLKESLSKRVQAVLKNKGAHTKC